MVERFKVIPAVYLVLIVDDKILLLRRYNTGFEDGNYSLPAGHIDGNESASDALAREAREELGIAITPDDLRFVHVMHRKKPTEERVDFFMAAQGWRGEITNKEPHKCDELAWYLLDALPKNTIAYVRQAIEHILKGSPYSEYGWD